MKQNKTRFDWIKHLDDPEINRLIKKTGNPLPYKVPGVLKTRVLGMIGSVAEITPRFFTLPRLVIASCGTAAIVIAIVLSGLLYQQGPPAAADLECTVAFLSGSASALRPGDAAPVSLAAGDRVIPGMTVSSDTNAFLGLSIAETASVLVKQNSGLMIEQLSQEDYSKAIVMNLEQGALTADVFALEKSGSFTVTTDNLTAAVHGTQFNVTATEKSSAVSVLKGEVTVRLRLPKETEKILAELKPAEQLKIQNSLKLAATVKNGERLELHIDEHRGAIDRINTITAGIRDSAADNPAYATPPDILLELNVTMKHAVTSRSLDKAEIGLLTSDIAALGVGKQHQKPDSPQTGESVDNTSEKNVMTIDTLTENSAPPLIISTEAYEYYAKGLQLEITNPRDALAWFEKALNEEKKYTDAKIKICDMYTLLGMTAKAQAQLLEILGELDNKGQKERIAAASAFSSLASAYTQQGNLSKAKAYLLEAQSVLDKMGLKDTLPYAHVLRKQGAVYIEIPDISAARIVLQKAQHIYSGFGMTNSPENIEIIALMCIIDRQAGNVQKSLDLFQQSMAVTNSRGLDNSTVYTTVAIAGVPTLLALSRTTEALQVLENADKVFKNMGLESTKSYADLLFLFGSYYETKKDRLKAGSHYIAASDLYTQLGYTGAAKTRVRTKLDRLTQPE
ncbi:MAG: FecR domain-containing protein [Spirochaetales bacterium]|nr:FecR domain-containing protein [Spirochaetales bacterium]